MLKQPVEAGANALESNRARNRVESVSSDEVSDNSGSSTGEYEEDQNMSRLVSWYSCSASVVYLFGHNNIRASTGMSMMYIQQPIYASVSSI